MFGIKQLLNAPKKHRECYSWKKKPPIKNEFHRVYNATPLKRKMQIWYFSLKLGTENIRQKLHKFYFITLFYSESIVLANKVARILCYILQILFILAFSWTFLRLMERCVIHHHKLPWFWIFYQKIFYPSFKQKRITSDIKNHVRHWCMMHVST